MMTTQLFFNLGNIYTKSNSKTSNIIKLRRFKSFFGVEPFVSSLIWNKLKFEIPASSKPKHLLWPLHFLKQYTNEHIRKALFKEDEKTIRYWSWIFVRLLADMSIINWEKRFKCSKPNQSCFCSLDGVDFRILEPKPFNRRWYSHKFRGPGLRYEIALNVRTGDIVWKNGGYPCGEYPDLKLSREAYVCSVNQGELTIADKGYRDANYFIIPNSENGVLHKRIMSRHETVNKRIRHFKILKDTFRHNIKKHPLVFSAVVNITQIIIENCEPLYSI